MHRDNVLYHFSEESDITCFEPRFANSELGKCVWAISAKGMYTSLLPRDCPRVTFRANKNTSHPRDIAATFTDETAVPIHRAPSQR